MLLLAVALLHLTCTCGAQDVESAKLDNALPTEAVSFDGKTLVLAWQGGQNGETIKEFIPEGQKLESWTVLASIREYPQLNDPRTVVGNLVRNLRQRNPQSRVGLIENPTTGEVIVDFLMWPEDASFVEFNIFRYHNKTTGGIVAEQYALRAYGDANEFFSTLKADRERLINLMASGGLVPVDPGHGQ